MRLIDADAEIKKIEEEIQRAEEIKEQWKLRGIPDNSLYDIDKKIRKLERNITDCKIEIRILKKLYYSIRSGQSDRRIER